MGWGDVLAIIRLANALASRLLAEELRQVSGTLSTIPMNELYIA